MAEKISNLLSGERLRPLWRRHVVQPVLSPTAAPPTGTVAGNVTAELVESVKLQAARIPREAPAQVLRELESALMAHLGSERLLLGHLLHPLSATIMSMRGAGGGAAEAQHPLARAAQDSVPRLIDRLDDALTALLAMQSRARSLLERLW